MDVKEKIIYEPFKTLEEQETFEKSLEEDAERNLNPLYEQGTEEDLKVIEKNEQLKNTVQGRLEERLTVLSDS